MSNNLNKIEDMKEVAKTILIEKMKNSACLIYKMPNTKLCALVVSENEKNKDVLDIINTNSCISKEGLLNYSGMELIYAFGINDLEKLSKKINDFFGFEKETYLKPMASVQSFLKGKFGDELLPKEKKVIKDKR